MLVIIQMSLSARTLSIFGLIALINYHWWSCLTGIMKLVYINTRVSSYEQWGLVVNLLTAV